MSKSTSSIEVQLRIPGTWASLASELFERFKPADCRFSRMQLVLPDGKEIEFGAMEADDQFAEIFRDLLPPTGDRRGAGGRGRATPSTLL